MRVAGTVVVSAAAAMVFAGCSDTVEVFVANPCGRALDVVVVDVVVDDADDVPEGIDRGAAVVPAGGVVKVGDFADDYERTLFVEEIGFRLVFDDEDLAEHESTLVIPASACPG